MSALLEKAARLRCSREHGRRFVWSAAYGGRMRDGGRPCEPCRLAAAAEIATRTEPMR